MKGLRTVLMAMPLLCGAPAGQAQGTEALTLETAGTAARDLAAAVAHHPPAVLGLETRLPAHCIPSALTPQLAIWARAAAAERAELEVTELFLKGLALDGLIAVERERVATTHGDWQERQRAAPAPASAAASALADAEARYRRSLAAREWLRAEQRQVLRTLGMRIGHGEPPPSNLAAPAPLSVEQAAPAMREAAPAQHALREIAHWWQARPSRGAAESSRCAQLATAALDRHQLERTIAADAHQARFSALRDHALPAARSAVKAAELRLDLAREGSPGAPRLAEAMTDALSASHALQAVEHDILREALRLRLN